MMQSVKVNLSVETEVACVLLSTQYMRCRQTCRSGC